MMLKSNLKPPINALRIVLGNDHDVVTVLKRYNKIYFSPVAKYLIPNVELLQNRYGISRCKIQKGVIQKLTCFVVRNDVFRDKLIRVEEKLGIPRDSGMFLYGLFLTCYSEKSIEQKCRLFRSFGWTQSEVAALIRRNPMCFTSAQGSIRERLEFLMKQLGYKPSYLASQPNLFTYSVKKRLLPRNRVLEVLKGKGLLRVNYTLVSAASLTEPLFLKKFVLPFEEVHQVYAKLTGSAV